MDAYKEYGRIMHEQRNCPFSSRKSKYRNTIQLNSVTKARTNEGLKNHREEEEEEEEEEGGGEQEEEEEEEERENTEYGIRKFYSVRP